MDNKLIGNEKNILFDTINKLQNEMNYVLVQTNDTVTQVNNAINNYVKQNDLNIIELYNRTDELSKKLEYITENQNKKIQNINSKLEYLLEKQNKPNFLQQIFSVKNEETHKVIRFLGLKIKIRRNKNG